eukprot:g2195.t1
MRSRRRQQIPMLIAILLSHLATADRVPECMQFIHPKYPLGGDAVFLGMDRGMDVRIAMLPSASKLFAERANLLLEISSALGVVGEIPIDVRSQKVWSGRLSNLKLGTHFLDARLQSAGGEALCAAQRVIFDLVPDEAMLRSLKPDFTSYEIDHAAPILGRHEISSCDDDPIRLALVTSLSNDGQNHLMLQQLSGLLRHQNVWNRSQFEVLILYSAHMHEPRPLMPALRKFIDVGLVHVKTYSISVDRTLLEQGGGIEALTERIERADTLRALQEWEIEPMKDLLNYFADAKVDILGFTHVPESDVTNRFIVQAARLAKVRHILCEPGKWARSSIYARRGVTGIVAPSAAACANWMAPLVGPFVPKCHVIPPGVDFASSMSQASREPLSESEIVIAWIGRLAPIKGPGLFVRVASHLVHGENGARYRFRIIGDGPLMKDVRDLAKRHGVEDRFVYDGWVNESTVLPILRREVDIVVHTHFEESFCITNVQAMIAGRPVVSFATAGVAEYLRTSDVHGIVVSGSPTPKVMAMHVAAVARYPVVGRAIGKAASREIRRHKLSKHTTGERYAALYGALLGRNASDRRMRERKE